MRLRSCVATLILALLGVGCRSAGPAECTENGDCPAEQVCNRHTRLCYEPDPVFTVEITEPQPGATVVVPTLKLIGNVLNADGGVASLEYQLADAGWTPLQASASGHFEAYPALPPLNGAPLGISVRAHDGIGSTTTTTESVIVDNVGPIATLSARDGERGHPLNIAVAFSEPVVLDAADGGSPMTLTPADGLGTWNDSRTQYVITGLQPDTLYTAEVPPNAVSDEAGHNSAETHASFRTRISPPSSTFTLTAPSGMIFDALAAASDRDGVVTLAAHAVGVGEHRVFWGWFDPRTGEFVPHTLVPAQFGSLEVGASVEPALDAPRLHTVTVRGASDAGTGTDVLWASSLDPDGGVHESFGEYQDAVPLPPGCNESGAADAIAFVTADAGTSFYDRSPELLPLLQTPDLVTYDSSRDWTFASVSPDGGLLLESVAYDCGVQEVPSTTVRQSIVLPSGSAAPGSLTAVTAGAAHALAFYDPQKNGPQIYCDLSCAGGCEKPAQNELRFVSLHDGGSILGAWRDTGTGEVTYGTADLQQGCPGAASDWQATQTIPVTPYTFAPVQLGATPGIVYIDSTHHSLALAAGMP